MEIVRYADRDDLLEIRSEVSEHVPEVHEPQRDGVEVLGAPLRLFPTSSWRCSTTAT